MIEPRCPLCGHDRTHFLMTPTCERQFEDQQCSNCEEPCKNWPAVQSLKDELERCKARISDLEGFLEASDKSRDESWWRHQNELKDKNEEIARLQAELAAAIPGPSVELRRATDPATGETYVRGMVIRSFTNSESEMVDEVFGNKVGDDGLIGRRQAECRLSDTCGEHYIYIEAEPRPTPGAGDDGFLPENQRCPIMVIVHGSERWMWACDSFGGIKINGKDGVVKRVGATNKHDWAGCREVMATEAFELLRRWEFEAGAEALSDFYQFDNPEERRPLKGN